MTALVCKEAPVPSFESQMYGEIPIKKKCSQTAAENKRNVGERGKINLRLRFKIVVAQDSVFLMKVLSLLGLYATMPRLRRKLQILF